MAAGASIALVKDGNGAFVPGGVRNIDESGTGVGPTRPAAAIVGGQGVADFVEVTNSDEAIASTRYGLVSRVVGLLASLGALTEAAPSTDTASAGLNGRLQRIAQRLTSLLPSAAHDAAIAGNPNRVAARAATANYTAVSDGDTADLVATLVGVLVSKPFSIPEADWSYAAASSGIVNSNVAVTIKAAGTGVLRNYITWIDIWSEALGTATEVAIRDGAGGTVLWRTKIGTGGLTGGRYIQLPSPIRGSAATLLEVITITASGSGAVYFNAGGYVAP